MLRALRPAFVIVLLLSLLTGLAYPLAVTGIAQLAFPAQANGSLLRKEARVVGSRLIGQSFDDPRYFWSRPSATSTAYDAAASSGSNLGPLNPSLREGVEKRIAALRASQPAAAAPIPVDLVTTSGSGLDPHISPNAARWQIARVARARGMSESALNALVVRHVEGRQLGILGEPRVNVLVLNLALDELRSAP